MLNTMLATRLNVSRTNASSGQRLPRQQPQREPRFDEAQRREMTLPRAPTRAEPRALAADGAVGLQLELAEAVDRRPRAAGSAGGRATPLTTRRLLPREPRRRREIAAIAASAIAAATIGFGGRS